MTLKELPVLRFVKTAPLASFVLSLLTFVLSLLKRMLDSFLFSKIIKQRRPVTLKELPVLRLLKQRHWPPLFWPFRKGCSTVSFFQKIIKQRRPVTLKELPVLRLLMRRMLDSSFSEKT